MKLGLGFGTWHCRCWWLVNFLQTQVDLFHSNSRFPEITDPPPLAKSGGGSVPILAAENPSGRAAERRQRVPVPGQTARVRHSTPSGRGPSSSSSPATVSADGGVNNPGVNREVPQQQYAPAEEEEDPAAAGASAKVSQGQTFLGHRAGELERKKPILSTIPHKRTFAVRTSFACCKKATGGASTTSYQPPNLSLLSSEN